MPALLTKTKTAWAIPSGRGFMRATGHPVGIVTFPTKKEAAGFIGQGKSKPVKVEISVKVVAR